MSQKAVNIKTSIPVRVNSTCKGHSQESEPSKQQKKLSPNNPPKGVLKQRHLSGGGNTNPTEPHKTGISRAPSFKKVLPELKQNNELKASSVHKTRHTSGELASSNAKSRHTSGEVKDELKSQVSHRCGHTGKIKETTHSSKVVGKSFSETKKLVFSLEQELHLVKKELADSNQQNHMLLMKQEEQEIKLGEDQENITLMTSELKQLQDKVLTNENEFEILGIDPVSKEEMYSKSQHEEIARKEAAQKAMELKEQLINFSEKNRNLISTLQDIFQES